MVWSENVEVLAMGSSGESEDLRLHQVFSWWVSRRPDAVAVVEDAASGCERVLSYGELDRLSTRLARALRLRGVGPEVPVGVCLPRCLELTVALLAIAKAGGAYLPLDPGNPDARMTFLLEDSGAALALTNAGFEDRLPAVLARRVARLLAEVTDATPLPELAHAETTGYLIYTSGSTGRPKAVVIPHGVAAAHMVRQGQLQRRSGWSERRGGSVPRGADDSAERRLLVATLAFDLSVEQLWQPLCNGGALILVRELWHPAEFFARAARLGVTVLNMSTAYWQAVAQETALLASGGIDAARVDTGSLRCVLAGGEAMLPVPARLWTQLTVGRSGPGAATGPARVQVINAYGPSETTVSALIYPLPRTLPALDKLERIPIGYALPGRSLYVLDREGQELPNGESGELVLGGLGLGRGYLGRPCLTAERFRPDPASGPDGNPVPGARRYHSGDLVRRAASGPAVGQIEFLGRIDQQVKVRGFRIELGEIEAVLLAHPGVRDAVVEVREVAGDARLVAWVAGSAQPKGPVAPGTPPAPEGTHMGVPLPRSQPGSVQLGSGVGAAPCGRPGWVGVDPEQDLRRHLEASLPPYMVPSTLVWLDRLPHNASGKVDRRALAEQLLPDPEDSRTDADLDAPATPTEAAVVAIVQELLGLDRVGTGEDLMQLGAHSLVVARLITRVRKEFDVQLPAMVVYDGPTVAELARWIDSRGENHAVEETVIPPILPPPRDGVAPLSFTQEQVWFLGRLAPTNLAYNTQFGQRLTGDLRLDVLERAFTEIVRRHEVLHTRFPAGPDGRPVQVLAEPWRVTIPVVDLTGLPVAARKVEQDRLIQREIHRPFDFMDLPLLRWTLFFEEKDLEEKGLERGRQAPRVQYLLQVEQHFVHDGWSVGLILREMQVLYEAFLHGEPSPLPELPVQYQDFARWQRRWYDSGGLDGQLAFWTQKLAGAPPMLDLPTDHPRPEVFGFQGGIVQELIPPWLYRDLQALGRQQGVTLFFLCLAAYYVLLHRYTGSADLPVGSAFANRRLREIEPMIGMIVNTVVLRTDAGGDPTFGELLRRVRRTVLEAHAHQDFPLRKVVEILQPERRPGITPMLQVTFSFHDSPLPDFDFGGLQGEFIIPHNGSAKADLNVIAMPRASQRAGSARAKGEESYEELRFLWEYNADLFDATTMRRMWQQYVTLLASVTASTGAATRLSALPLLAPAERHQLLWECNDTFVALPTATLDSHFASWVARTPGAPAVEDRTVCGPNGEEAPLCWTYRELDQRAEAVARRLRDAGVGRESIVGLAVERRAAMLAGMLGILKAGGAYLPLDPEYPDDRLRFVLEDAGVRQVLADARLTERFTGLVPEGVRCWDLDRLLQSSAWVSSSSAPAVPAPGQEALADSDQHLAYVIYTSGSTGQPKGAGLPHQAILRLTRQNFFQHRPGERVAQLASISFDASCCEIWGPLTNGGCLTVLSPQVMLTPQGVAQAGVDVMCLTASVFHRLARQGPEAFGGMRVVVVGGEALDPHAATAVAGSATPPGNLYNVYGPTEAAVVSSRQRIPARLDDVVTETLTPIGVPIGNTELHVLDRKLQLQPAGVPGELCIGGPGLARGYLRRPRLTAEVFIPDPFNAGGPGCRLYRSGDLCRRRADGRLEFLGRLDGQLKLRGFRIETGEIERALTDLSGIAAAAVLPFGAQEVQRLAAFLVATPAKESLPEHADDGTLRQALGERLPEFMVPARYLWLDELPVNTSGKLDRKALAHRLETQERRELQRSAAAGGGTAPGSKLERQIAALWCQVLGLEHVGVEDTFFDLGGHSMLLLEVYERLRRELPELTAGLTVVELFRLPTVRALAAELSRDPSIGDPKMESGVVVDAQREVPLQQAGWGTDGGIAIVGMAGRFPGAVDVPELWRRLLDGFEGFSRFEVDEMIAEGVDPAEAHSPDYVPVFGVLDGVERFDAAYFDYAAGEARILDPQHRLLLEMSVHALEDAGLDPRRFVGRSGPGPGHVGVFAGFGTGSPYLNNLQAHPELAEAVGRYQLQLANMGDSLATRVAYKLRLTGPAVNVQTACSTSLVAVHLACQSLLAGDCDAALAGGVTVGGLRKHGYLFQEGHIVSPDGRCRPFDAEAAGTVGGDGGGVVVLKRLADARADGDSIYAVIRGSAINNDAAAKVGFTAPSVDGQAAVVVAALARAGVEADSVRFIETHGTGTALGDPIEVAGLRRAFAGVEARGHVALGAIKANVGHLNAGAGVAGLIKAALAVHEGVIPPHPNFQAPHPQLDLDTSPFYVNAEPVPWPVADGEPRRAGVSSLGVGGTNAHVVVEQSLDAAAAEAGSAEGPRRPFVLLPLSARTPSALRATGARLAEHLAASSVEEELADVAYTLQVGRFEHPRRAAVVVPATNMETSKATRELLPILRGDDEARWLRAPGPEADARRRSLVFLFPGGGAQYAHMGEELYRVEPVYRHHIDACAEGLRTHFEERAQAEPEYSPFGAWDLRQLLYPSTEPTRKYEDAVSRVIERTSYALPALFATSYALAGLWMSWGLVPSAMIGHSLGEYVAAALAEVVSLDDALALVALRGRLFDQLPAGAMLSVPLGEAALRARLREEAAARVGEGPLSIAAVNAPDLCVASGPVERIEALRVRLAAEGLEVRRLHIEVAAHSSMVEPILQRFEAFVASLDLHAPRIPYISNVTGTWITEDDVRDPGYWRRHLRGTVRYAEGVGVLLDDPDAALVEAGPGHTLSTLARRHPSWRPDQPVLTSLRHPKDPQSDVGFALTTLARLWAAGAAVDWNAFCGQTDERRCKLRLPGYPFESPDPESLWVPFRRTEHSSRGDTAASSMRRLPPKETDVTRWFWTPAWRQRPLATPRPVAEDARGWLLVLDADATSQAVASALRARLIEDGVSVRVLEAVGGSTDVEEIDLEALSTIAVLTGLGAPPPHVEPALEAELWRGYGAVLAVARRLAELAQQPGDALPVLLYAGQHLHAVLPGDRVVPERAPALGPLLVLPQESDARHVRCRAVDLDAALLDSGALDAGALDTGTVARILQAEATDTSDATVVAWRGGRRWCQGFESLSLAAESLAAGSLVAPVDAGEPTPTRRGVYLLTGGLGNVGLRLAEWLLRDHQATVILTHRSELPPRAAWTASMPEHPDARPALRRLAELESLARAQGGEVVTHRADVADRAAMTDLAAEIAARWGRLDGVVHGAGELLRSDGVGEGKGLLHRLPDTDRELSAAQFRPKITGTRRLARMLDELRVEHGIEPRFCVLLSSLASVLGGVGFAGYAAANLYLDAYAAAHTGGHPHGGAPTQRVATRWLSTNWDAWTRIGEEDGPSATPTNSLTRYLMTPAESVDAFRRTLAAGEGLGRALEQIAVASGDLAARLALWRGGAAAESSAGTRAQPNSSVSQSTGPLGGASTTPESATGEPQDPLEAQVAEIWGLFLGTSGGSAPGRHDNFFELGGHSLMGSRLMARLRQTFDVELPMAHLFEFPTIAGLTAQIQAEQGNGAAAVAGAPQIEEPSLDQGADELAAVLAEVEGLSDEDLEAQLRELTAEVAS